MKTTDKYLIGIVAGIVVLVVVALVVTLMQPESTYQAEDTPGGVAYNYLLALKKADYERAYGYLSPQLLGYPKTLERFIDQIQSSSYNYQFRYPPLDNSTLSVKSEVITINYADVTILASIFSGGSLFESGTNNITFDMKLRHVNSKWKITNSDRYFLDCWTQSKGCR